MATTTSDQRPPHQPALPRRSLLVHTGSSTTPVSNSLKLQTAPYRPGAFFRDPGNARSPFAAGAGSPRHDPQVEYPHQQRRAIMLSKKMALNRDETVFVSSAGDVVVCRCRSSSYTQKFDGMQMQDAMTKVVVECQNDLAAVCCEVDEMSESAQDNATGLCGDWGASTSRRRSPTWSVSQRVSSQRSGLLGGSPADVAAPLQPHSPPPMDDVNEIAHNAFQAEPLSPLGSGFDDDCIVPIRSFDYSQSFSEVDSKQSNVQQCPPWDCVHEEKKSDSGAPESPKRTTPQVPKHIHGVPTFLSELAQVKITQVSAHPLGSHVLLISEAGLLYSYGLNEYGQLGLGSTTSVSSPSRGYIMSPTIVTPLIENGGKAVCCAAGVSHSLVAVMTEERRLVRSQSSFNSSASTMSHMHRSSNAAVSLAHHQLYGFGRNDFMKIGLVSPKVPKPGQAKSPRGLVTEIVKFPRRVALRCRVAQEMRDGNTAPPPGIFAITASEEHSAALVHRSTGEVELYTWGNASHGALGLPQQPMSVQGQDMRSSTVRIVPVPSFVSALSRSSNPDAQASSLLLRHRGEYPVSVSLGKRCTFVTTSMGRAFSFGQSEDGMLGLGEGASKVVQPQEITCFPSGETVACISAGATHAVALSSSGSVYAWGTLPENYATCTTSLEGATQGSVNTCSQATSTACPMPIKTWNPTKVETPVQYQSRNMGRWKKAVAASAGYDSSAVIVDSGNVLSCGKCSGRLGLGETSEDVAVPRPLFGGLRLWYQKKPSSQRPKQKAPETSVENRKAPPISPSPAGRASSLARGTTFS